MHIEKGADGGTGTKTHLELGEREPTPEALAVPVDEREQVPVALHLLHALREPALREPAVRVELMPVRAPDFARGVHVRDRHGHVLALRDGEVVHEAPVGEPERPRERDHVVLGRDAVGHGERRVQAQDLVHDRVEEAQARAVRELLPGRVCARELRHDLGAQAGL